LHQIRFWQGTAEESQSAPPGPLAGFKGPTYKGRGRRDMGKKGKGKEREGAGGTVAGEGEGKEPSYA